MCLYLDQHVANGVKRPRAGESLLYIFSRREVFYASASFLRHLPNVEILYCKGIIGFGVLTRPKKVPPLDTNLRVQSNSIPLRLNHGSDGANSAHATGLLELPSCVSRTS